MHTDTRMAMDMDTAVAPTEARLRALCAREHPRCFACRPRAEGGLGLDFRVDPDGSVSSRWLGSSNYQSYEGVLHGGMLATVLDSAMVHALFARGVTAQTAELRIRYKVRVDADAEIVVRGRVTGGYGPLHELQAEVCQGGNVCVKAWGKFMEVATQADETVQRTT